MSIRSNDCAEFLELLDAVLGIPIEPIPLHGPTFTEDEVRTVSECVRSGWVSSAGEKVMEFERALSEFTLADHVVAVVNGTTALEMALRLVGVQPGDEVLVPAATFVATANAVVHCGAVPHFVDIDHDRLTMSPELLKSYLEEICEFSGRELVNRKTGARVKAVVPMHTFGHAADIQAILRIANEFHIEVVEDAAESLGTHVAGQHTGTFGRLGILSFNGNKVITTGGGGAILTNDDDLARRARHLTTTAKLVHPWEFEHDAVAWNYRMPNLNAALGCAQMRALPSLLAQKRSLAESYARKAQFSSSFDFISEHSGTSSNYWLNAIRLKVPSMERRDELLSAAIEVGYICRPLWKPLHLLRMFNNCPRAPLNNTLQAHASIINLPSSASLAAS